MIDPVAQGVLGRNWSLSVGQGSGHGRENINPAKRKLCPDFHNPFVSLREFRKRRLVLF